MAITPGRLIPDNNFSTSKALGTAASTVQTDAFDVVGATLDANSTFPENVTLQVDVPATTNLVSAAVLTFTVLADSATPPTTALPLVFTVTGTAGNGAATSRRFRLPADCARYVAVKALAGTSGAGDNSAVSYTTKLLF